MVAEPTATTIEIITQTEEVIQPMVLETPHHFHQETQAQFHLELEITHPTQVRQEP